MNNEKVLNLIDTIEAALRELAAVTGEDYISAYIVNGSFGLDSGTNENGQRVLSFYRMEANNE